MNPPIVTIEAHFREIEDINERFPKTWGELEKKLLGLASSPLSSENTSHVQKLIKQKFSHLLENRIRGNIAEKKDYGNIFVTVIDISLESRIMTLIVKISEEIFSYFDFEVDFIKSSISSYLSEIFTEILDLEKYRREIEYFIGWTVKISQSDASWSKGKKTVTNFGKFFTTPDCLSLASSLLFSGVLLKSLIQGELAITINHEIPPDFSIEVNRSPLEVEVKPLNIDVENNGCQGGYCDRCIPTCNPC